MVSPGASRSSRPSRPSTVPRTAAPFPENKFKNFRTMNKSQIRFARTLTATWKVLRDPVLTAIYLKKWKRRKDITQTIYGFVFNEMYCAA